MDIQIGDGLYVVTMGKTSDLVINSLSDLKRCYVCIKTLAEAPCDLDRPINIGNYIELLHEFNNRAFNFLIKECDFVSIDGDDGAIGFDSEGKEIYREVPFIDYNWKERFVEKCLKILNII